MKHLLVIFSVIALVAAFTMPAIADENENSACETDGSAVAQDGSSALDVGDITCTDTDNVSDEGINESIVTETEMCTDDDITLTETNTNTETCTDNSQDNDDYSDNVGAGTNAANDDSQAGQADNGSATNNSQVDNSDNSVCENDEDNDIEDSYNQDNDTDTETNTVTETCTETNNINEDNDSTAITAVLMQESSGVFMLTGAAASSAGGAEEGCSEAEACADVVIDNSLNVSECGNNNAGIMSQTASSGIGNNTGSLNVIGFTYSVINPE
jgi:hypothetical protein